jgi:hypothetical protein
MIELEWEHDDPDDGELLSAVVLGHSKDRKACMRAALEVLDRENIMEAACWFTGRLVPEGFISMRLLGL